MPTHSTATRATGAARPTARRRPRRDAVQLLRADHRKVQELFDRFEKARNGRRKAALAREICGELRVHTQIEEEILYPAARDALKDEDLIDEATVEHASAKDLIAQIEDMSPGEALFDAKVTVLGEYIKHHVKEEHKELFPKLKKSRRIDLKAVGAQLAERKEALLAEM